MTFFRIISEVIAQKSTSSCHTVHGLNIPLIMFIQYMYTLLCAEERMLKKDLLSSKVKSLLKSQHPVAILYMA